MEEIWKDIKDYEGVYQVSNYGRIRSLDREILRKKVGKIHKKGQILKLQKSKNGYYTCKLSKNNKKPSKFVHRIVAETFLPNPNNYPCVNHIDENKLNNKIENLEWCTYLYNNTYGTKRERLRKAQTGKKYSQETKEKMSKIHKGKKRVSLGGKKYVYR